MSTFGNPDKVKLGRCKLIEEVMIGEDKVRWEGWGGWVGRDEIGQLEDGLGRE